MADPVTSLADVDLGTPIDPFAAQQQAQLPDITKQTPETYATLTTNQNIANMHAQNLRPDIGTAQQLYLDSLKESQEHFSREAEAANAKRLELAARQQAVTPQTDASGKPAPSLLQQEEIQRAAIEEQKQKDIQQWQQTGETKGIDDKTQDRINGYVNGYDVANKVQQYHYNMAMTTPGAAGFLRNRILGFVTQPDITSQETKDFNAYSESSLTALARGVYGDQGQSATKEAIRQSMHETLTNKDDTILSAGHKAFMIKDQIMQNLINERTIAAAAHRDTAPYDAAIGKISGDYYSATNQQFAPPKSPIPLIAQGQSVQGQALQNNLNAAASGNTLGAQSIPGGQTWSPQQPAPILPPVNYSNIQKISNDPGTPGASPSVQALVTGVPALGSAIGSGIMSLMPKPDASTQDFTLPQEVMPNPREWGQ